MTREFERPARHRTGAPVEGATGPDRGFERPADPKRRPTLLPFASLRHGEGQAWMVTFTDLIALMLTFFVMLFAMMKVDEQHWQGLTASLADRLDGIAGPSTASPRYARDSEATALLPATDLDYLSALIGARLQQRDDAGAYQVERGLDSLIVRLPTRLAFGPGDSEPRAAAAAAMAALAETLRHLENRVELAGYADGREPAAPYASSWELSLLRAVAVAGVLREAGYERPIAVQGYGDSAAEPGRLGRVDLVIHADGGAVR
ncbi:MAG: flagellar motor protein MotB [Tistlia sp.]|uniref:flagellar motor protein MotB n=1 Tax=Tistlia sp. TaxID=3057121 RepID=UPI0034A52891